MAEPKALKAKVGKKVKKWRNDEKPMALSDAGEEKESMFPSKQ